MTLIKKIVLSTGGTGGHIFPAIAISEYLTSKNIYNKITTDKRGYRFIKNYDLSCEIINSKSFINKNPIILLVNFCLTILAFIKSFIFLIKEKPDLVIGFGGYASVPVCLVASIFKIKLVIYENNLIVGKANKFLANFSNIILSANEDVQNLNRKNNNKIIVTGNIVRKQFLKKNFNLNTQTDKNFNILILGGSQSAKVFGEKLPKLLIKLFKNGVNISISQQCTSEQQQLIKSEYSSFGVSNHVFTFSNNINEHFEKANLVITRSGASIIGEILNSRVPFICIPLPKSADNHQMMNAKFYEKKGCCLLVNEQDIDNYLSNTITKIKNDKNLVEKMIKAQSQILEQTSFKNFENLIKNL